MHAAANYPGRGDLTRRLRCVSQSASYEWELTDTLTPRETEVLKLLSTGNSNSQIADLLFVTEGTAKSHVERILAKLGVADRMQAAVWAAQRRLV